MSINAKLQEARYTPDVLFSFEAYTSPPIEAGCCSKPGDITMPIFKETFVEFKTPSWSFENCCCYRKRFVTTVVPRHKLVGYDFWADEWNFGMCTKLIKCCCCLADKKALTIMTSDKTPGYIALPVYLNFFGDFAKELPDNMKDYIFSSLNGVAENAQLMSHMQHDGLIEDVKLDFKIAGGSPAQAMPRQEALFVINYGTKGSGRFSNVKFYPAYVSLIYGNNTKCCYNYCRHPCRVVSHDSVSDLICVSH